MYSEQRGGGDPAAVQAAFDVLDAHYAALPPPAPAPGMSPTPMAPGDTNYGASTTPPERTAPVAPVAPPAGNFTLDDL